MSTSRKVKGFIFYNTTYKVYYRGYMGGSTPIRAHAHVYSREEATQQAQHCDGWGGKDEGKWIVVYE